jgi:hypothetical protein
MIMKNFINKCFSETSKTLHSNEEKAYWSGAFLGTKTDTQRHWEMLKPINDMIKTFDCKSALTVGDNLCREAAYIKKISGCHATASNLVMGGGMHRAVEDSHVDKIINADIENLPFEDNSIDLVLAKETFHHWPRPMLGFYEMLRVASKCVILIEPLDHGLDGYEEVGNYKYQPSIREIMKSAWALYLPAVAHKGFNDPYGPHKGPPFDYNSWLEEKNKLDELGHAGKRDYNLAVVAIYKTPADWSFLEKDENIHLTLRPPNRHTEVEK